MDCLRYLTRLCCTRSTPDDDTGIEIRTTPHVDLSPPQELQDENFNPVERRRFYLVRTDIEYSEVEIFGIPMEQFTLLEPLDLHFEARAVST